MGGAGSGRKKGSKNKAKNTPTKKRGRPPKVQTKKRGRPSGVKNKPKGKLARIQFLE